MYSVSVLARALLPPFPHAAGLFAGRLVFEPRQAQNQGPHPKPWPRSGRRSSFRAESTKTSEMLHRYSAAGSRFSRSFLERSLNHFIERGLYILVHIYSSRERKFSSVAFFLNLVDAYHFCPEHYQDFSHERTLLVYILVYIYFIHIYRARKISRAWPFPEHNFERGPEA